jgi:hypothetical protein
MEESREKTLEPSAACADFAATLPAEMLAQRLARLAPNRVHESSWFKNLLCSLGFHRWYHLNLGGSIPAKEVCLCRWCPKVKVRGVLYGD